MTFCNRLCQLFGHTSQDSAVEQQAVTSASAFDPLFYSLETPKPQQLLWGSENRFSGWIVHLGSKVVTALEVRQADRSFGPFPVCQSREDLAVHLPMLPEAKTCGFSFDLLLQDAEPLAFSVLYQDGSQEPLFCYELDNLKQDQWSAWKEQLADLPQPSAELVYLTQGITNITEYQNSILPAVATMQAYLVAAGVPPGGLRSILDFGCGSGRLLLGWHIMRPELSCCGCDINQRLVGWAQRYLPSAMQFQCSQVTPPTPYATGSFDLIYAISVFTHLSIPLQQQWVEELYRLLRPGGFLLITLHGLLYAHRAFYDAPEVLAAFINSGHAVTGDEEGANSLAAFHTRAFVEKLFKGFRLMAYYPQGHIGVQRTLFPVAHMQDVYVLQRNEA